MRKRTIGILSGIGVLAVGGVAAAAILLTTTVSGTATVNEVATSNSLDVSASSANGSRLDCSAINVSGDNKTLTFNPKLTKPVGGGNASNVPVAGGECTITLKVKNTGDTTLKVSPTSKLTAPAGWGLSAFSGNALAPIAPDQEATITAKLTATQAAVTGPVSGQIVYEEVA